MHNYCECHQRVFLNKLPKQSNCFDVYRKCGKGESAVGGGGDDTKFKLYSLNATRVFPKNCHGIKYIDIKRNAEDDGEQFGFIRTIVQVCKKYFGCGRRRNSNVYEVDFLHSATTLDYCATLTT